ncbi:MAG: transcriptional regulator [Gammaproteobacteria bacterium]|nr:MAG: transcriptional regulator [Gammaproteobacteria bacterium]
MATDDMKHNAQSAAQWLKGFANEHRLMLLCSLADGELAVSELNARVPLSQSALSQHLAFLREAGHVVTRRDGQRIFYRLADDGPKAIIETLYQRFCNAPQPTRGKTA